MSKPTIPAPESEEIEMDAMDLEEWERGQSTPQAPDAKLTELVKQSAAVAEEPKRPTQTLARVLVKQQQTGIPAEPGSLDAQTVRAPPPTATIIHREREKKGAGAPPAPPPGANPFDSATVRTPPRIETATVPAPTQTQTPVAPNVVARAITSARVATPPAGVPVAAPPQAAAPAAKPMPARATPPAGIPKGPLVEDSEGWALPDDADDADWSSLAPSAKVVATTAARGDATPAPAKVGATTVARRDATPAPARSPQGQPVIARTQTSPVGVATIPRAAAPPPPRATQGQPAIARTQTPPAGVVATTQARGDATPLPRATQAKPAVTREETTPRPGPPPMPRTTTRAQPAVTREEGTPRPGPPPMPRTTTQAQPAIARMQTPAAGVPAAPSSAVTPPGGVTAQRDADAEEATSVGNLSDPDATTTPRQDLAPSIGATSPSSVSLEALAAAAAAEDVPELEPSQSGDDLAVPMFSPEPSVVIVSERSEPVRLPEPPQAPAPLPPPPRPRTQPAPVVVAPQPMVPQAPVLPQAPVVPQAPVLPPPPPIAPVAIGAQPVPPMPEAPAAPRDERWTQTDSLPIVRPPGSRKLIAIIGGAVALVTIVVVVIATRGPSKEPGDKPVIAKHDPDPKGSVTEPAGSDPAGSAETGSGSATEPEPPGTTPTGNTPAGNTPTGRTNTPTGNTPTGTTPTGRTPTGNTPTGRTPTGNTPTGRTPTGKNPTTIGKNPKTPNETPGPVKKGPSAETIAAAHTSYEAGNSKLFAGDLDAAISAYKQTLALYPGYAAGYRGLGLAYAQQGNKAKALQALRTYLSAAPNAKDADLIRKRIAGLAGG